MDFAKNILSKYGWQDGDGLGKEKQGIKKPIKANFKFDQAGLGAVAYDSEFGNHWWERCFNDAAQNVKVQKEQNGNIIVDLKDAENSVEVSTKGYSVKKLKDSGSGVYGNSFLSADAAVSSFALSKYKVLTDEELFKACGGRTAHKGARHGLKLSGKLARVEQQEKELLAKMYKHKTEHQTDTKTTEFKSIEGKPTKVQKRSKEIAEEILSQKKKKRNNLDIVEQNNDAKILKNEKSKTQVDDAVQSCSDQKGKKRDFIEETFEEIGGSTLEESIKTAKKAQKKKKAKVVENELNHSEHDENRTRKKKEKRVSE